MYEQQHVPLLAPRVPPREGELTAQELTQAARKLMRMQPTRCAGLSVESPFELLDRNGDGLVTKTEFCDVLDKVWKARQMQNLRDEAMAPPSLARARRRSQHRQLPCV